MVKFDIPPKDNRTQQVIISVLVLLLVSILIALLAKALVGLVVFLLGSVFGIGSQFMAISSTDKNKE